MYTWMWLISGGIALSSAGLWAQDFNARAPHGSEQQPAFAQQTRALQIQDQTKLVAEVIAQDLEHPWGMSQLPDGRWLVTERPGRLRLITAAGQVSEPIQGLPVVDARGQGGLLDVVVKPDFTQTRQLWWSYAEPRSSGNNATAVATGYLSADERTVEKVRVIFQQQPAWDSTLHFGSRLVFDSEGRLFVTTGERSVRAARGLAQDLTTHLGKVLYLDPQSGAGMNPPIAANALAEIWSYGHRNIQAAALDQTGQLWTVEHGPRGGDELNQPQRGLNYGWPIISYGTEYTGFDVGKGLTAHEGMEQPVYYWDPVIAPSGMSFYDHDLFTGWRHSLLIGALGGQALVRLVIDNNRVVGEARYLQGWSRIRDVEVAQDGSVMVLTDAKNGALVRLRPDYALGTKKP
ncbi:MAG TPA: PQQ-dependent sugar dehydrogenase [Paenalcaligenes hominis]|uniref:PQQ-dependent sugar dehydrogenase n=1 Tax=Paenalcaligenes hominis TaxID=643674 RepID=A0A9D2VFZ5_9BURK|nr:PQQ-dependent sugar dehydrogenase [Paenalcaligenes hominis]